MKRIGSFTRARALALVACLTGCRNSAPPVEEFMLAPLPMASPRMAPASAEALRLPLLRVRPLVARGFLDRRELAWREGEVRAGPYHYRRWSEPPAEAVTRALIDALRARGCFEQVDGSALGGEPFVLSGELIGLHESSDADGSHPRGVAALELRLEGTTKDGVRPIFTATRQVAAADGSMEALVVAISAALAEVLAELVPQIEAAVQARA